MPGGVVVPGPKSAEWWLPGVVGLCGNYRTPAGVGLNLDQPLIPDQVEELRSLEGVEEAVFIELA